ncbi:MAG: hypothetical protein KC443_09465 [Anaerolineales bacterium]|nr:hypothetical protein [Anaerolineales bacterium]
MHKRQIFACCTSSGEILHVDVGGVYPQRQRLPALGKKLAMPVNFVAIYYRFECWGDRTWHGIHSKKLRDFYREHLMCFLGDLRLDAFDGETLRRRRDESGAKAALLLQIQGNSDSD